MPFATRDGVRLFYNDTGSGGPALLFVHGWCCDSSHWRRQVAAFRRTHRVVTTDLRGHGRSSKPKQDYTMDAFAEDLEWLMAERGLNKPVIIGHSMGGVIALRLARRKTVDLGGLVMIDPPLHLTISPEEIGGLLNGLDTPAYLDAARILIDTRFFRPDADVALREPLTEAMLRTPQHVMASALRQLATEMYPTPAPLDIPALFIDAGRPVDDLRRIEEALPGVEIARTAGAGHFNMIEAPDQVNAVLRTFITSVGAGLQTRASSDT